MALARAKSVILIECDGLGIRFVMARRLNREPLTRRRPAASSFTYSSLSFKPLIYMMV